MMYSDDDLRLMFDTEFGPAVSATWKGSPIPVIFDTAYYSGEGEEVGVISSQPIAKCITADVADAAQGDTIIITGKTYRVRVPMPDGTGITDLQLEEA